MTTSHCVTLPDSPKSIWLFERGDLVMFNPAPGGSFYVVLVTKNIAPKDLYIEGVVVHNNQFNEVGAFETKFNANMFTKFNGQVTLTA